MFAIDSIVTTDRVRYTRSTDKVVRTTDRAVRTTDRVSIYTTNRVVRTTDRVNIHNRQSSVYKSGAPNENIVQNHLNTALLNVF